MVEEDPASETPDVSAPEADETNEPAAEDDSSESDEPRQE